jgi:hypothetical protein
LLKHFVTVRPTINAVKEMFKDTPIIGAEVGTYKGIHAEQILKALPNLAKLYLIEPYERYEGYTDFDKMGALEPTFFTDAQKEARKRLEKYKNRIVWIQNLFECYLVHELLDFIYIDGNHKYDAVLHDIEHAEILVKHGVIGGHDYYPENHYLNDKFGVGEAVREYYGVDNFNWKYNDWWIIKK